MSKRKFFASTPVSTPLGTGLRGIVAVLILLLLGSQAESGTGPEQPMPRADRMSMPLIPADLIGVWERRGYGELFVIDEQGVTSQVVTQESCLVTGSQLGLPGFSEQELNSMAIESLVDGGISVAIPDKVFPILLHPLDTLPKRCFDIPDDSPAGLFDLLWDSFNEYYAFFELRNVNWAARYEAIRPSLLSAGHDDNALFNVFVELLSPLDDAHVAIVSDTQGFSPAVERGVLARIEQGFDTQDVEPILETYVEQVLVRHEAVLRSYLDEGSLGRQGSLRWGTIDQRIGYLSIESMDGFVGEQGSQERVIAGASMDAALAELQSMQRLIIDVRFNPGGSDRISLALAARFNATRQVVLSKRARSSIGFQSPSVDAWLASVDAPWLKPVTVLTSRDTIGAAEIFTIAMRGLPHVTVVGDWTNGSLSDVLFKPLPNGWLYGFSNEVYLDADGIGHESVGVPPDVYEVPFSLADIESERDAAIERAVSLE